jgi:hypothetical protein
MVVLHLRELKYAMSVSSSTEHTPDSDTCEQCKEARTIVLPTGERYRVCAPNNWKSYECAAKQLIALKKPAAHAEFLLAEKSTQRG